LPVLGICGGEQLLNIVLGGTLIQHVPDEVPGALPARAAQSAHRAGPRRPVTPGTLLHRICGTAEIAVNSTHHQAVKAVGDGVAVNALALGRPLIEGIEVAEAALLPRRAMASRNIRSAPATTASSTRSSPPAAEPAMSERAQFRGRTDRQAAGARRPGARAATPSAGSPKAGSWSTAKNSAARARNVGEGDRYPGRRQAAAGGGAGAAVALSQAARPGHHGARPARPADGVRGPAARAAPGDRGSGGSISARKVLLRCDQ